MSSEIMPMQFSVFGRTLSLSPGRIEFNRLHSRFVTLAREQEPIVRESINQFVINPEPLLRDGKSWARQYFSKAAELAVEELMKRGCLDLDVDTYLDSVFDLGPWDRWSKAASEEYMAVVAAEQQREAERAERTENAGDSWAGGGFGLGGAIKGAIQAEVLNVASAAISEGFNKLGRKQSQKENAEKILSIFNRRRDEIVKGVYSAIAEGADVLVKCLNEHGVQVDGIVSAADAAKAERMCNNLKTGKVPAEMVANAKIGILEANPYCQEFYEYEYMSNGDVSGELEKVASYFGISFENRKGDAFLCRLGECSSSSESDLLAYREKAVALAAELKYDGSAKLAEIDARLSEADKQAKMAGGRMFDDRETAAKQRELCEIESSLDLSSEDSAIKGKQLLLERAAERGIDFSWKMDRVETAISRFDQDARTVDGRIFETREIAASQRLLCDFEKGLDISTEERAIAAMQALESKIVELGVDGEWKTERIRTALSRFEREACVAFGRTYAERKEAMEARGNAERFFDGIVMVAQQCNHRSVLCGSSITAKKAAGAENHLGVHSSERLLVLIDTSLFGNVKTGLAVTSIGLRWKNSAVPTSGNFISWGDLSKLPQLPTVIGKSISIGNGMAFENGGLMTAPVNVILTAIQRMVGFSREANCWS